MRVQAAAAIAAGVDPRRVLRAITKDAAAILGVDDKLGEVAEGKQADLVVFAGDPLDPATPVRLTMSRGRIVYEANIEAPKPVVEADLKQLTDSLPSVYAIKSQRILTSLGVWQAGRIVVDNGTMAAIAADQKLPEDIPIFDVGVAPITPGLLVAHSNLGAAASIDDRSDADASNILAADAYDPSNVQAKEFLEAGFLRIAFAPGSANVVAGNVCLVRVGAAEPVCDEGCAMKFVGRTRTAVRRSAASESSLSTDASIHRDRSP